ncbi:MAG: RNA methyltransferase [Planctomycetia bacterium]|nr:RNA methyltransferase [Planctomycetia bacterium]
MPLISVDSPDDPRLAPFRHLKRHNETRWSGLFVAEGLKLAERVVASRFPVVSFLTSKKYTAAVEAIAPSETPVYVAPPELIDTLAGFRFHYGVLTCARRLPEPPLESLVPRDRPRTTIVVCPDVQDPENLGGIFRLAAAFGVEGVILGPRCPDWLSRRVLRTSMGASLTVPTLAPENLDAILAELRDRHGVSLWATVADPAGEPLRSAKRPDRLAVLFGSEGHGLDPRWLAICNRRVTIPMREGMDSLNVAAAAGIALYELGFKVQTER